MHGHCRRCTALVPCPCSCARSLLRCRCPPRLVPRSLQYLRQSTRGRHRTRAPLGCAAPSPLSSRGRSDPVPPLATAVRSGGAGKGQGGPCRKRSADWSGRAGADGRRALIGPGAVPHGGAQAPGPVSGPWTRTRRSLGAGLSSAPLFRSFRGCPGAVSAGPERGREPRQERGRGAAAAAAPLRPCPAAGSYRPSYEEMLRFYSYYKQATAGSCQGPRPGFWDPIGRYKW